MSKKHLTSKYKKGGKTRKERKHHEYEKWRDRFNISLINVSNQKFK